MNLRFFVLTAALALAAPMVRAQAASPQATPADSGVFVSEGTLDGYAGTYLAVGGTEIKVWREGDRLMLQAGGQAAWPLSGHSETVFVVEGMDTTVTFWVNAAGEADSVVLRMDGHETKAIRR